MHTLTHMPTKNTHTLPSLPPAGAQHPHRPACAAWIWDMQPLGTLKHMRGQSHNTDARPHTEAFAPAPCTLVPGVLRGPPTLLMETGLAHQCPAVISPPKSLPWLPTALNPNKSHSSDFEGSPPYAPPSPQSSSSCCLCSLLWPGAILDATHTTPLPMAAFYPVILQFLTT